MATMPRSTPWPRPATPSPPPEVYPPARRRYPCAPAARAVRTSSRRGAREAEGAPLLREYGAKHSIEGSLKTAGKPFSTAAGCPRGSAGAVNGWTASNPSRPIWRVVRGNARTRVSTLTPPTRPPPVPVHAEVSKREPRGARSSFDTSGRTGGRYTQDEREGRTRVTRSGRSMRAVRQPLTKTSSESIISCFAPVAQLDRVPGYELGGREFESLRARHLQGPAGSNLPGFFFARMCPARVPAVGPAACARSIRGRTWAAAQSVGSKPSRKTPFSMMVTGMATTDLLRADSTPRSE